MFGGLLETSRRHGRTYWALTSAARSRLSAWRQAGEVIDLYESPQHRTWRMARAYSAENLDRLRAEVSSDLDRAVALLARGRRARSDAFFELKEHLSRKLQRLGSITHCLCEWQEPDDATQDIDEREDPGKERLSPEAQARLSWLRNGRRAPGTRGVGTTTRKSYSPASRRRCSSPCLLSLWAIWGSAYTTRSRSQPKASSKSSALFRC